MFVAETVEGGLRAFPTLYMTIYFYISCYKNCFHSTSTLNFKNSIIKVQSIFVCYKQFIVSLKIFKLFQQEYKTNQIVRAKLSKIMTLNLLPPEEIREAFRRIAQPIFVRKGQPGGIIEKLKTFLIYFNNTWMNSHYISIREWCVHGMSIRTNNDLEGMQNRNAIYTI